MSSERRDVQAAVQPIRTAFEQTFKNIDHILHKHVACTSERDYAEQSSCLLFLK